jgi:hypothetical protein
VERKDLEDSRARVLARELIANIRDMRLNSREEELADREKRLAEREQQLVGRQFQELATARSKLEELQVAWVGEAQKVWDFLGQTEASLVPLGFSPLCIRDPVEEVNTVLPLLDPTGAKMLTLEEVIDDQLEVEGRALAKEVAEHVLTCFRSQDPQVTLEPMEQGPAKELDEATLVGVEDTAKLVAERFERQLEDA